MSNFRDDGQATKDVWSILMDVWDPFGVKGIDAASTEYDQQIVVIAAMLERGAGGSEIASYLARSERELLSQDPDLEACGRAAAALVALRDN